MSLFQKAAVHQAKLKGGIFGSAGSGKTFTAAEIMIGLARLTKSKKPVFFMDTENGSDFLVPRFKTAGVELHVLKSRSFPDMLEAVRESEKNALGLIIDSETHVWEDFKKSYLKQTGQEFIELWDWAKLKETWQQFTDLYVNSDVHIIRCGRAASVYEQTEEVRGGRAKRTAMKVGSKMKTESEGGYEPSLLMEMEKVELMKGGKRTGVYIRRCHVVKDRFDVIDSKDFDDPKFENFLPHIERLNLEGTQQGIDTSRTAIGVFDVQGDDKRAQRVKKRAILVEEIDGMLMRYLGGQGAKEKLARQELVFNVFGTRSWKAMQEDWVAVPLEKLEDQMRPQQNAPSLFEQACIKEAEKILGGVSTNGARAGKAEATA